MTRGKKIAVGIGSTLGVLALAGVIAMYVAGVPPAEVLELFGRGTTVELDETPEPHPGGPRVLLFAIDGLGETMFHEALAAGELPRLAALMGEPTASENAYTYAHACELRDALSILPSTTMAAWSSIFSGEPVAVTGVPGNEWFAREEARFYAPAPVSVTGAEDIMAMLNDGLVGNAIASPTLFEQVHGRTHVSLNAVHRGADIYTQPNPAALADLFVAVAEGITGEESVSQEAYREVDEESIESVLEAVDEHGLPTLQVVYFPGIDLYTHIASHSHERQRAYLSETVDTQIGRVLDRWEQAGVMDETWVVLVSDHGHTPVMNDDRHALEHGEDDEPTAVLEAAGFRVREGALEAEETFQAVVAYQGAIAYVYLADRSTCEGEDDVCDWSRPPRYEEDVLPAAQAFQDAGEGEGVTGGLEGALDLVFARRPQPLDQDAHAYEVFADGQLTPVDAWERSHDRDDLLHLADRMRALSAGPLGHRAGDILLLARSGVEIPIEERFYFSGPYRSWHGSPSANDSTITFTVAHRARSGEEICSRVRREVASPPTQLDVTPLVLMLLGQDGR